MATIVSFLNPYRVQVETENGDRFILGYHSSENYQIDLMHDKFYTRCVQGLFDKYYNNNSDNIWGPILAGMFRNNLQPFLWVVNDKNLERERIGNRIKEIRKEHGLEAKELAEKVGIDPGNLCRIEQGKFSVGIDILSRIAGVLKMRVDFVPINNEVDHDKH